jgi:CubicO group peptidase (beta-lactamase class C family)
MPYDKYVSEQFLGPLGRQHTHFDVEHGVIAGHTAIPYGPRLPNQVALPVAVTADSGHVDMLQFIYLRIDQDNVASYRDGASI